MDPPWSYPEWHPYHEYERRRLRDKQQPEADAEPADPGLPGAGLPDTGLPDPGPPGAEARDDS